MNTPREASFLAASYCSQNLKDVNSDRIKFQPRLDERNAYDMLNK